MFAFHVNSHPSILSAKWLRFRNSFWFLPLWLNLLAIAMGLLIPYVESFFRLGRIDSLEWMMSTADSARSILGAIAGALITETTMIFSVTMVSLSLTASQYGSQPLRTFMTRSISQLTLGMFLGTSIYCLIVLFWVQDSENATFVPHISVVVALILTIVNHLLFIYFLDQIARSLQSNVVVESIAEDLSKTIARLYPSRIGQTEDDARKSPSYTQHQIDSLNSWPNQLAVLGPGTGFLQMIDTSSLMRSCEQSDVVIRLQVWPGNFISVESPIATIYSRKPLSDDSLCKKIHASMILGSRRTPDQDVESAVWELVEVAVRALSPGINDPNTALICINYLGVNLRRLAGCLPVDDHRADEEGTLRLIVPSVGFEHVLKTAFDQIRLYGRENGLILENILIQLSSIRPACSDSDKGRAVRAETIATLKMAEANVEQPDILAHLKRRAEAILSQLEESSE